MRRSSSSRSIWRNSFGPWRMNQVELAKTAKFVSGLLPSLNRKLCGKEYSSLAHAVEAAQIKEQHLGEAERRTHGEDQEQHGKVFSVALNTDIMNQRSISGNNTKWVLQLQITELQDNIVATGTNVAVGPGAMNQLTTGTNKVAIGSGARGAAYGILSASGNVMLGANTGGTCQTGSNKTFLGSNTAWAPGQIYLSGSDALGSGSIITTYNQLMVEPNVSLFNMAGLAASTGYWHWRRYYPGILLGWQHTPHSWDLQDCLCH